MCGSGRTIRAGPRRLRPAGCRGSGRSRRRIRPAISRSFAREAWAWDFLLSLHRIGTTKSYISFKARLWSVPQAFIDETLAIRPRSVDGQYRSEEHTTEL